MAWEVFLFRHVDGQEADVDREAVRAVLKSADHRQIKPDHYTILFPDGSGVTEFHAHGLDSEESFTYCCFEDPFGDTLEDLMAFILEMARAGDMAIMGSGLDDAACILTRAEQARHLPPGFCANCRVAVCGSPEELKVLLTQGYSAWKRGCPDSSE